MNRFFIDRPVFAAVTSIAIVLAGLVAIRTNPSSVMAQVAKQLPFGSDRNQCHTRPLCT